MNKIDQAMTSPLQKGMKILGTPQGMHYLRAQLEYRLWKKQKITEAENMVKKI